jgi:hypothetical protein
VSRGGRSVAAGEHLVQAGCGGARPGQGGDRGGQGGDGLEDGDGNEADGDERRGRQPPCADRAGRDRDHGQEGQVAEEGAQVLAAGRQPGELPAGLGEAAEVACDLGRSLLLGPEGAQLGEPVEDLDQRPAGVGPRGH